MPVTRFKCLLCYSLVSASFVSLLGGYYKLGMVLMVAAPFTCKSRQQVRAEFLQPMPPKLLALTIATLLAFAGIGILLMAYPGNFVEQTLDRLWARLGRVLLVTTWVFMMLLPILAWHRNRSASPDDLGAVSRSQGHDDPHGS